MDTIFLKKNIVLQKAKSNLQKLNRYPGKNWTISQSNDK